jgi:alpha-tubulin suppressor-like RCC1 family protein
VLSIEHADPVRSRRSNPPAKAIVERRRGALVRSVKARLRGGRPAVLCAVLLAACGSNGLDWSVIVEDPALEEQTVVIENAILEGGCAAGEPLYRSLLALDGSHAPRLAPRLSGGAYGFASWARDGSCRIVAEQCADADLPQSRLDVSLAATAAPRPACPLDDPGCRVGALALGGFHSCALFADGRLACFGANDQGQLGMGDTADRSAIEPLPELTAVTAVTAGTAHTCAIAGGRLLCWGGNDRGARSGSGGSVLEPAAVDDSTEWVAVEAGNYFTAALRSDGALFTFGDDERGQLGRAGDPRSPEVVAGAWRSVAAGASHTCAIRDDRSLACWGDNQSRQLGVAAAGEMADTPVDVDPGPWQTVAAGQYHSCAIRTDGALWCWGENMSGQLGLGNEEPQLMLARVGGLSDWTAVTGGNAHSCGTRADGSLHCWGRNVSGELGYIGLGSPSPIEVTPAGWSGVAAGALHTCAIRTDGSLRCWATNTRGQSGTGTNHELSGPTEACAPGFR